ncbi:CCA tRNA nucleotidyltransferase [Hypnocyclicus thermotrophus]|nr:CCA tRNA nucleotidyltransferase [Hypnocyclicus thermotrophus]
MNNLKINNLKFNKIINLIIENNGIPFLTGGYIRDYFLEIKEKDYDIEVYNITFNDLYSLLKSLYPKTKIVGKKYPIILLDNIEISTNNNIYNSINRRDFSINSIYYNLKTNKFIDFSNGLIDLKNKIIKLNNLDNIKKDPIRIFRAVYLYSKYNFHIDSKTAKTIKNSVQLIKTEKKERIFNEFEKIFNNVDNISKAIKYLNDLKIFNVLFSDFNFKNNILFSLNRLKKKNTSIILAILFFYTDKKILKNNLKKITNNKTLFNNIYSLTFYYSHFNSLYNNFDLTKLKRIVISTNFDNLLTLYSAINNINSNNIKIKKILNNYNMKKSDLSPIIQGKDLLKYYPNLNQKYYGKILKILYNMQLNNLFNTHLKGLELCYKLINNRYIFINKI